MLLLYRPNVTIYDFGVRTILDADYKDAQIWIRPDVDVVGDIDTKGWQIKATLYDAKGTVTVDGMQISADEVRYEKYPQRDNVHWPLMEAKVANPAKWTFQPHPEECNFPGKRW